MAQGTLEITLLPGARELLRMHARELPQRDDLCGAFCGALALGAAGLERRDGEPLDQDAVALAAGSVVSARARPREPPARRERPARLPAGDPVDRRPRSVSGTTDRRARAGARRAVGREARGDRAAAARGPRARSPRCSTRPRARSGPVTLIANLATHHLWGSRASLSELLDHLERRRARGAGARLGRRATSCAWSGASSGPRGSLYAVADTYPSLGGGGVHLQPGELLARALARPDKPAGGMIAVAFAEDAAALREGAAGAGLREGLWDNGTPEQVSAG